MRAARKLLGVPTIGGGSAKTGGGGGGSQRSQIHPPSHPEHTKTVKKRAVSRTFALEIAENTIILLLKGSVSRDFLGTFLACMDRSRSV